MSDLYQVIYTPQAAEDLKDIYSYIAFELQEPVTAKNPVNRIREEIRSLDFMLARYMLCGWEPWKHMGMHKVAVDRFIIFYLVSEEKSSVTIVRIVYGGRELEALANSVEKH